MSNLYTLNAAGAGGGGLSMIIMLVAMIAIFYFIGIRPQKKQEKEANEMRRNLAIGDEITTIGGIVGKVVAKREDSIIIESSSDKSKIKFAIWAVRSVEKKANEVQESKPATFKVKKQ